MLQLCRRCCIALVVYMLMLPGTQAGQLAELYERALSEDPRFLAARHEYDAQAQERPLARSAYLPSLDIVYENIETEQNIVRSDNEVFGAGRSTFPTDNLIISLRQPIFRYDLWQSMQRAKAVVQQAAQTLAAEEQELIFRVTERYLAVLAANDGFDLALAEQLAIKENLELVQARRAAGMANRVDVYDAKARAAVADVQVLEAENRQQDALRALEETVGPVVLRREALQATINLTQPDPVDGQSWVDAALAQNLRIAAAGQAVEAAQREVRVQRGARYPSLDLVVTDSDRDTGGTLFGGGSEVETQELLLRVQVPIYKGGAVNARVRRALAELGRARDEFELLERQSEREARGAYRNVVTGLSKVPSLLESLEAQRSALESKERGYEAGLNTALDILDAQRDFYLTRGDYLQSRYDFLLDSLRLKRVAGILNQADLMAVDAMLVDAPASRVPGARD